jgi:hypothetical protein
MPAQALAAIVYFRLDGVLYEHTIDPREVDSIYLQTDALARFVAGGAAGGATGAAAATTSTATAGGQTAGGRPRRPGVPHHATRQELEDLLAGKVPPRGTVTSGGPPPCMPSAGSIRVVNPADVPDAARLLLDLAPDGDATGGCIHCTGCGSWCPD